MFPRSGCRSLTGHATGTFIPLPERRLIIHLSGEVEIGASDGAKRVLRAGDIRLMEDVTGKGHSHNDLTPSAAVYVLLND